MSPAVTARSEDTEADVERPRTYEVEKIVGKRKHPESKVQEYRVRWKGYSERDDTWEWVKDLDTVRGLINEFNAREREKKRCEETQRKVAATQQAKQRKRPHPEADDYVSQAHVANQQPLRAIEAYSAPYRMHHQDAQEHPMSPVHAAYDGGSAALFGGPRAYDSTPAATHAFAPASSSSSSSSLQSRGVYADASDSGDLPAAKRPRKRRLPAPSDDSPIPDADSLIDPDEVEARRQARLRKRAEDKALGQPTKGPGRPRGRPPKAPSPPTLSSPSPPTGALKGNSPPRRIPKKKSISPIRGIPLPPALPSPCGAGAVRGAVPGVARGARGAGCGAVLAPHRA